SHAVLLRLPPRSTPFPYATLFRSLLGVEGAGFVLGIVARMQTHRRFEVLLEALKLAAARIPGLRAVVIERASRSTSKRRCVCMRSEEHTSELQSRFDLVCRLLLEK